MISLLRQGLTHVALQSSTSGYQESETIGYTDRIWVQGTLPMVGCTRHLGSLTTIRNDSTRFIERRLIMVIYIL